MDPQREPFDAWLDAQLKAVPMPDGLAAGLRAIADATNHADNATQASDAASPPAPGEPWEGPLASAAVPEGLEDRLKHIPYEDDEGLDAALCDVPIPHGLRARLARIPPRANWPLRMAGAALAASLLVAAWVGLMGSASLFLARHTPGPGSAPGKTPADAPWPALVREALDPHAGSDEIERLAAGLPADNPHVGEGGTQRAWLLPRVKVGRVELPAAHELPPRVAGDIPQHWLPGGRRIASGLSDPLLEAPLREWPLATHGTFEETPDWKKVAPLAPRGVKLPLATGVDLPFFVRTGVHPFLPPQAHPALQTSVVPLAPGRSSYELTRHYVADGDLPPPGDVRTEDFLAAQDFAWPRPAAGEALALHAAGGPSPFAQEALRLQHGGDALRLLHLGVQARDLDPKKHPPVRLTVVLDASASMAWGGRLEMACAALASMVGQFEPRDRLSLVLFHDTAEVFAQGLSREDAPALAQALAAVTARGTLNVVAGLREAYRLAEHDPWLPGQSRRVILITDGLGEFDPRATQVLGERLAEGVAQGIPLDVIELRQGLDEPAFDQQLAALARAGAGRLRHATDADHVRWMLQEMLSGVAPRVAKNVSLTVTFHPDAVLEYRLLGHEAAALAGLLTAPLETDFYSGQSASALYEVRLRPGGANRVATVEVAWHEPLTAEPRRLVREITRGQFAATLGKTPASFQQAAMAAEVAELLRESPFTRWAPNPGSWAHLREQVSLLDSRLQQRPTFAELVAVAQQAEKCKPTPRGRR